MAETDKELCETVAATVAEVMIARRPSLWETARKALVNVTLSALGAGTALIFGFWLKDIQQSAADAKAKAAESLLKVKQNEKTVAVVTLLRAQLGAREAALNVLRDAVARLEADVNSSMVPRATPVTAEDLEKQRERLRKLEDKEIYRIQQQSLYE